MVPYGQAWLTATASAGFVIRILDVRERAMLNYQKLKMGSRGN